MKKLLLLLPLLLFSNSGLAFWSTLELNKYLDINIDDSKDNVEYLYGKPTEIMNEGMYYLYRDGSSDIFILHNNKVITIISDKLITLKNGKTKKTSDGEKYDESLVVKKNIKESAVENVLGKPSVKNLSGREKTVYYKKYNLFLKYNAGKVTSIGVSKNSDLNHYSDAISFAKSIHSMNLTFEKMEKMATKAKKQMDLSDKLGDIAIGDSLIDIKSRFGKVNQLNWGPNFQNSYVVAKRKDPMVDFERIREGIRACDKEADKQNIPRSERLLNSQYTEWCDQIKKTMPIKIAPGEFRVDFDDDKVYEIIYSCIITDYSAVKLGNISCQSTIADLNIELKEPQVYCNYDSGAKIFSTKKFNNYAVRGEYYYEFLTKNNSVSSIGLSSKHSVSEGFEACN